MVLASPWEDSWFLVLSPLVSENESVGLERSSQAVNRVEEEDPARLTVDWQQEGIQHGISTKHLGPLQSPAESQLDYAIPFYRHTSDPTLL